MKLKPGLSERKLGSRSIELVGRIESEIDSEFFDPRVDFPADELARLKEEIRDVETLIGQRKDFLLATMENTWWLGLVDPEFQTVLKSNPLVADALKEKFDDAWKRRPDHSRVNVKELLASILPAIQLFPALRQRIRHDYTDNYLDSLLMPDNEPLLFYDRLLKLMVLIQLYPEKRLDWLRVCGLSPHTLLEQLPAALIDTRGVQTFPDIKAELLANALLVFPELRSEILFLGRPLEKLKKYFASKPQPFHKPILQFGFDLTVIGAESARIDEHGQIQLQMKSRPIKQAKPDLPVRPTL